MFTGTDGGARAQTLGFSGLSEVCRPLHAIGFQIDFSESMKDLSVEQGQHLKFPTINIMAVRRDFTGGTLGSLPAELLEEIYTWITTDQPPTSQNLSGVERFARQIAWVREFCNVRLVCRSLRDAAWKSFGKVLGSTTFDLRSRRSIENLMALGSVKKLVPWIKSLRLTCYHVCPAPSGCTRSPELCVTSSALYTVSWNIADSIFLGCGSRRMMPLGFQGLGIDGVLILHIPT